MSDRRDFFDDILGLRDDDFPGWPSRKRNSRKRHPMPCPPIGVILTYADQTDTSISPRKRERIREHIQCCETCLMHYERAMDEVLHGPDREGYSVYEIYKEALEVQQAVERRQESSFKQKLHTQIKLLTPPLGPSCPLGRWLPIATTLAVIALVVLSRPAAVVIHAEELIERAIAYERTHAIGARLRVRQTYSAGMIALGRAVPHMPKFAPFAAIRDVVNGAIVETRLVSVSDRDRQLALEQLFEKHRFDWNKPLCLTSYSAWRASLSRKHDTVEVTGDMLVLRTTTTDGDLREVTLAFQRDSYRLVRQSFLFEGLGRIVIAVLERQQAAPANQRDSASAANSRAAVDTGTGTLAPSIASRPPAAAESGRAASRRLLLSRWLDRTFPPSASAARSAFLPDVEHRSSSVRQHLIVLQRLANVSASEKLKNGSEADRAMVRQQVELEYQALVTHLRALEERLNVLFGNASRSFEFQAPLPPDWERRASTAMPHATRLEHRLQRLFTREDLPLEETQASRPGSARAAFEALWESIHGGSRN